MGRDIQPITFGGEDRRKYLSQRGRLDRIESLRLMTQSYIEHMHAFR